MLESNHSLRKTTTHIYFKFRLRKIVRDAKHDTHNNDGKPQPDFYW